MCKAKDTHTYHLSWSSSRNEAYSGSETGYSLSLRSPDCPVTKLLFSDCPADWLVSHY